MPTRIRPSACRRPGSMPASATRPGFGYTVVDASTVVATHLNHPDPDPPPNCWAVRKCSSCSIIWPGNAQAGRGSGAEGACRSARVLQKTCRDAGRRCPYPRHANHHRKLVADHARARRMPTIWYSGAYGARAGHRPATLPGCGEMQVMSLDPTLERLLSAGSWPAARRPVSSRGWPIR